MNKIREYRQKLKMTQVELAKILNIGQGTLSAYETGRFEPDMDTMRKMSTIFGVSLDTLFGDNNKVDIETNDKDREIWELREKVRRDPERNYLFSLARDADIDDVRQAVAIIDALKNMRR